LPFFFGELSENIYLGISGKCLEALGQSAVAKAIALSFSSCRTNYAPFEFKNHQITSFACNMYSEREA
jgi:hypothetical protein